MADEVRKPKAAPYHFIPVLPDRAVTDEPCFHDVLDLEHRWTGELHCTLMALTPLLPANAQYSFAQASTALQQEIGRVVSERLQWAEPDVSRSVDGEKKILEPLALE